MPQSLMQPGCQFWCQEAPPPPQLQYLHWPLQLAPSISSSVCNRWTPQKKEGAHRVTQGLGMQEVLVLYCTLIPWVAHKDKVSSDPLLRTPVIEACLSRFGGSQTSSSGLFCGKMRTGGKGSAWGWRLSQSGGIEWGHTSRLGQRP